MNPLNWPKRHRIALGLGIAVGALAGTITGYVVYGVGQGADGGVSFGYWINSPFRFEGFWWGVAGGTAGAAMFYIKRLTSN
ncbi:MAG: hypothetical protein JWM63_2114 [Gammaproteobacteria bacterium]|jgi:hypothetical protein|nr:hypothetical protein [Gammaproteobacteria bacterium]